MLDLSNNKFSGTIPQNLDRLRGFAINGSSQLSANTLYTLIEVSMKGREYTLPYVLSTNAILDLSTNMLTGDVPTTMGKLSSLRLLNLSGNQLEGRIPTSLSNISTLEQLDMAKNNLSGGIPPELSKLSMLAVLNISSNNLCGPIPKGTQFTTWNETSFQKNKCLCGYPLQPCNQKERTGEDDNDSNISNVKVGWLSQLDEKMSLIALGLGIGIGFGGVVGVMIGWKRARHWVVGVHVYPKQRPFYGLYRFPT